MPGLEVRVFGLEFHQRTCNIIFHLHKFNFQTGWDSVRIFSLFPFCILSHAATARLHIGVGVGLYLFWSCSLSLSLSFSHQNYNAAATKSLPPLFAGACKILTSLMIIILVSIRAFSIRIQVPAALYISTSKRMSVYEIVDGFFSRLLICVVLTMFSNFLRIFENSLVFTFCWCTIANDALLSHPLFLHPSFHLHSPNAVTLEHKSFSVVY